MLNASLDEHNLANGLRQRSWAAAASKADTSNAIISISGVRPHLFEAKTYS
jgi:hypothetical protein